MNQNKHPKITVVTPSYNQGLFLEETILSVLEQNYPNLDYIIIDGGSKDNSVEIIKKYEKYLKYWVSEKDYGQTHAINKGLKQAHGEIAAYINSDDTYEPYTFETVRKHFLDNPNTDFVYGDVNIINEYSRVTKKKKEIDFDFFMGCCIGFGLIIPQQSSFWKVSIHEKIGYFDELLYYNMDGDFFSRVAQNGFKIEHIHATLSNFRWHKGGKTTIHNKIKKDKNNYLEANTELKRSYNYLPFYKFVPYRFSKPFRNLYRLKRIAKRLYLGHYFVNNF